MHLQSILPILLLPSLSLSAPDEPCLSTDGTAGVCTTVDACSSAGGVSVDNACPADDASIKCCTKPSCSSGGNCRWESDCAGTSTAGECPGPSQMQCCSSSAVGFGGYAAPDIPAVGACQQTAVDGATTIVEAWPGRVREVFCIRDCACPGDSDHCCGLATDMMCADGGSVSLDPFSVFTLARSKGGNETDARILSTPQCPAWRSQSG